jgi:SAM-dependent methyltransferase
MDQQTVNYYSKNAQAIAERYESVVSSLSTSFTEAFKQKSKLLDVGCGSGRDLALLAAQGHYCYVPEGMSEMHNH